MFFRLLIIRFSLLCVVVLSFQGCSKIYVKSDPLLNLPDEKVFKLMLPDSIDVIDTTGGVFSYIPKRGTFLPGKYNVDLKFSGSLAGRTYVANPEINFTAHAGIVARLDYEMLNDKVKIKIIDITFWEDLKKYHGFDVQNYLDKKMDSDIFKFPDEFNSNGYMKAKYNLFYIHSDVFYRVKAIKYLAKGIDYGHLPSIYTVSVFTILNQMLQQEPDEEKIKLAFKLFMFAKNKNYELAGLNYEKIDKLVKIYL